MKTIDKTKKCRSCKLPFVPPTGKASKATCERCNPEPAPRPMMSIERVPLQPGAPGAAPHPEHDDPLTLNAVLRACSAFDTVDELARAINGSSYRPTMRCDLDHRLLYVVADLEVKGLGDSVYVYFTPVEPWRSNGVATCWGFPPAALERAARAAGVKDGRASPHAPVAARVAWSSLRIAIFGEGGA